jgi:Glyoxalase-like domain
MRITIVIDCNNLDRQADFWCRAADYHRVAGFVDYYQPLKPNDEGNGPSILLQRVPEPKAAGKNRLHIDLHPADGPAWVRELQAAGATTSAPPSTEFHEDFGTTFQVMSDPEGNEFCVVWREHAQSWD